MRFTTYNSRKNICDGNFLSRKRALEFLQKMRQIDNSYDYSIVIDENNTNYQVTLCGEIINGKNFAKGGV